jgi:hypothetical protein
MWGTNMIATAIETALVFLALFLRPAGVEPSCILRFFTISEKVFEVKER